MLRQRTALMSQFRVTLFIRRKEETQNLQIFKNKIHQYTSICPHKILLLLYK